jgi:hypothetical protein
MTKLDGQIRQFEGKLTAIKSIEVLRASSSTLNKMTSRIKTRVIKGVSKETKIKPSIIRRKVFIKKSTTKTQMARIRTYVGEVSAISLFKTIKNGRLRRKVAGKKIQCAFVADGSKGKGRYTKGGGFGKTSLKRQQVLKRSTSKRYPLEVVKVSILKPVTNHTKTATARVIKRDFSRLYHQDLNYRLQKYAI